MDLKDAYFHVPVVPPHHQFLTVDAAGRAPFTISTTAWPVADPTRVSSEDSGSSYSEVETPRSPMVRYPDDLLILGDSEVEVTCPFRRLQVLIHPDS